MHAPSTTSTTEADGHREERLHPNTVFERDLFGRPLLELEPSDAKHEAVEEQRQDGAQRGSGHPHADGREHPPQERGPLVGAARKEQLLGGGAFEIDALQGRGAVRSLEIDLGRLGPSPCLLERRGELGTNGPRLVGRARARLERQAVETRGLIKGQLGGGLFAGALGVARAALRFSAPQQVSGNGLHVRTRRGVERPGKPPVMGAQNIGRQLVDDRLANAIVARLDDLAPVAKPPRTMRSLRNSSTSSSVMLTSPQASARVEKARGLPPTATTSARQRAPRGSRASRSPTIWASVRTPSVAPVRANCIRLLRTSSSMRKGLPLDSRATARGR